MEDQAVEKKLDIEIRFQTHKARGKDGRVPTYQDDSDNVICRFNMISDLL